jgi:hypothetical protein
MDHPPRLLGAGGEFSPQAASFEIDGEDLVAVVAFEGVEPRYQRAPSRAFPQQGDALQDFADGNSAYEEVSLVEGVGRALASLDSDPEGIA